MVELMGTDRDKIIKGLQSHIAMNCEECPYWKYYTCAEILLTDALELLKEQEPILLENQHKPYGIGTNANSPWISRCPRCDKKVEGKQTRFCKYCGQAVKWE